MELVAISDTHSYHKDADIPIGDILIHCGDGELDNWTRFNSFLKWFKSQPHKHKIFVPGNHDFLAQTYQLNCALQFESNGIHMLVDKELVINGIKFYGSPWTVKFYDWAFMKEEKDLQEHWDNIPVDTDYLIVHGPAYKHLDIGNPKHGHLGSKTLAKKIDELKIPYVLFGHIHGSYGVEKTKHTTYVNCALLDEDYDMVNDPIIINHLTNEEKVI